MKKFLAFILFAGFIGLVNAQQSNCAIVNESFSQDDLNDAAERMNVSPEFACFIATEGFRINDFSGRNLDDFEDISGLTPARDGIEAITLQNFNEANFNLLNYNLELHETQQLQYRIGNSGKVISVYSLARLNKTFNSANN